MAGLWDCRKVHGDPGGTHVRVALLHGRFQGEVVLIEAAEGRVVGRAVDSRGGRRAEPVAPLLAHGINGG